jgi:hypothetical protein
MLLALVVSVVAEAAGAPPSARDVPPVLFQVAKCPTVELPGPVTVPEPPLVEVPQVIAPVVLLALR